ncbi:MAG: response regulator [Candidatus Aminicenantes bacterium]|jgi:CheY-like chemotaxis protein/glycine cleavage system H lipoate-binding protein
MKYKANILVVDDDKSLCEGVALVLNDEGYTADMVTSGKEALEMVNKKKYALVIVDLMMPGMDGIDLLKEVKKKRPNTTVIMITGYPSIKTAVKSIKLSAFDYIPKPFTPNELRSLVARALEERRSYEEIAEKMGIEEEKLVELPILEGLYCIPEHSWAKIEKEGNVRIGIHHVLIRTLKGIEAIEFPGKNEIRYQGEVCVRITDSHHQTVRLWTPVTCKIKEINKKVVEDFSKLIHDPYDEGWLVLGEPLSLEEDIKNLTYPETK